MTRRIAFAPTAQVDLAEAVAWYIQPSVGAGALRRLAALQRGIYRQLTYPYLGHRTDHARLTVVIARFRVIYRISPIPARAKPLAMRILGSGQN